MNPHDRGHEALAQRRASQRNVISLLDDWATGHPQQAALTWRDRSGQGGGYHALTYAELSAATESVAAGLADRGIEPGDCVFIFVPMIAELYVALFGVLRLGGVAVFLDSWSRRDQLSQCARQVRPRGFVGPEAALAMVDGVPGFQDVRVAVRVGSGTFGDVGLDELVQAGARRPIEPVSCNDSALVTFTTGSSGVPKGADRTHGFLVAQHEALGASVPYADADVDLPVFPVFSLNNLASGVTTVLPDLDLAVPRPDDGGRLLRQIVETRATCATLSPSLLRAVTDAAGSGATTSLRRVVTGGAPIGRLDVERFSAAFPDTELHILYGSTEVEPIAHLLAREMPDSEEEGVCLGAPSPALRLRFITPTRDAVTLEDGGWNRWEVDAAQGGELLVAGPHVCQGYFRNPEAQSRAKVQDEDGTVWHRTGDICRLDGQGRLWILGRVHNAIRRDGRLLFPVTAEMEMKRLPFVARAAYVGVPHERLGEAAWAVFTRGAESDVADAEARVRRTLDQARVAVDRVLEIDGIPMDPRHHSKVDVDALRSRLEQVS